MSGCYATQFGVKTRTSWLQQGFESRGLPLHSFERRKTSHVTNTVWNRLIKAADESLQNKFSNQSEPDEKSVLKSVCKSVDSVKSHKKKKDTLLVHM